MRLALHWTLTVALAAALLAGCGGSDSAESVERLRHRARRRQCPSVDFTGADLEDADLSSANLSGANLDRREPERCESHARPI